MPRYDQWRRLTGNSNRPDLLDLGKRLLGYLAEQRALSGVKSMTIQRQAPDGSVVTARFDGDLPSIHIQAAGGKQAPEELSGGFVTWPSAADGATPVTPESAVYLELAGGGYHRYYFDPAQATVGARPYAQWFPGDPTLELAGNIDWRDSQEKHCVTWHGPHARYWSVAGAPDASVDIDAMIWGKKVYRMGAAIFDWDAVSATLLPQIKTATGATWMEARFGYVFGAAIERGDSPALLVVVRTAGDTFRETDTVYALLRVPLVDYKPETITLTLPDVSDITLEASILLPLRDPDTLVQLHNQGFGHPWFFNSSATQARCIHAMMTSLMLEKGDAGWAFSQEETPLAEEAETTTVALDYRHLGYSIPNAPAAFNTTPPTQGTETKYGAWTSGDRQTVMKADYASSAQRTLPGDPWVACAVDYRGDTPVYAYQRLPLRTSSLATENTDLPEHPDFSRVYDNFSTTLVDVPGEPADYDVLIDYTDVLSYAGVTRKTSNITEVTGGLRTDDIEISGAATTVMESTHTFAYSDTFTAHMDGLWSKLKSSPLPTLDPECQYQFVHTYHIENSFARTTTETRVLVAPLYLDLRNGLSCVAEVTATTTTNDSFNETPSDYVTTVYWNGAVPDVGNNPEQGTFHTAKTKTYTYRIVTRLGSVVLSDTTASAPALGYPINTDTTVEYEYRPVTGEPTTGSPPAAAPGVLDDTITLDFPELQPANVLDLTSAEFCDLDATTFSAAWGASDVRTRPGLPNGGDTVPWPASFGGLIGVTEAHPLRWMRDKTDNESFFSYGSWQSYRDRIAFSHVAPVTDASVPAFVSGITKSTLPVAVGPIAGAVLYHPIWVLPAFKK